MDDVIVPEVLVNMALPVLLASGKKLTEPELELAVISAFWVMSPKE